MPTRIPVSEASMVKSVYGSPLFIEVACYPDSRLTKPRGREECLVNLSSLSRIGIKWFYTWGPILIRRAKVLGKGFSSIVTLCSNGRRLGVCKILRLDSRRSSLRNEALILARLGILGLAPRLYSFNDRVIFMEYVSGCTLREFLEFSLSRRDVLLLLIKLVEAAGILDRIGVDHGELSRPGNHVLIRDTGVPVFIDFESASMSRKPRNLTSLLSSILIANNALSDRVAKILGNTLFYELKRQIRNMLVEYKRGDIGYNEIVRYLRSVLSST